jgi:type II secretory pathway component PulJ
MSMEWWKALVLILFEQLAILVVLPLHTWASVQEQRQHWEAQARLEARLIELYARLARRLKGSRDSREARQ